MIRNWLLLNLLFFLLAVPALRAQDFSPAPTCAVNTQNEYLRHYEAGTGLPANLVINPPAGVSGTITWSFIYSTTTSGSCGSSFPGPVANGHVENLGPPGSNLRATFNSSAVNRNVVISSTGNLAAGEHNLTIRLSSGGVNYVKNFRFLVRRPVDILFVLDRSGSMECDVDEDVAATWPGCVTTGPGDGRRWDILTASIDNFVSNLDNSHVLTADLLSVVYFDGGTAVTGGLVNDVAPFASVATFKGVGTPTAIAAEMSAPPVGGAPLARNGTSLGNGMIKAINSRYGGAEDPSRRQIILLFTDGEQNTGNWIKNANPNMGRRIQTSSTDNSVVLNLDNTSIDDLDIFTAGTLFTGTSPALLQSIADDPSMFFDVQPGDEYQFGSDLAGNAFNEIFNQASPRFIGSEEFALAGSGGSLTADFTANRQINRLIFQAFYNVPFAGRVKAKIYRNGIPVDSLVTRRDNDYVTSFIFSFHDLPELPSEGEWRVELLPPPDSNIPPGAKVQVFATADDHAVHFTAGTREPRPVVGRALHPELSLFEEGQPVTNATITATIVRPGDDLGDLLARTPAQNIPAATTESGTCAERKYAFLKQTNPGVLANLWQTQRSTVNLSHRGQGQYDGTFNQLDVTGVYKIQFTIAYDSPRFGKVRRFVEQTRYVGFPPPRLRVDTDKIARDGESFVAFTVDPTYTINGQQRQVGPGFGPAFGVSGQGVRVTATDNCDGTYRLGFSGDLNQPIELYLLDQLVHEGSVEQLLDAGRSGGRWGLSLHGGRSVPLGGLDSLVDGSFYAEVDLAYQISHTFGLELVGGYYAFDPDFYTLGGTLYLQATLGSSGPNRLTVGAGPGYYFPEGEDSRWGGSLRASLSRGFGRVSLGVEGAYFRLSNPELSFGTLGLALKIRL